MAPLAPDRELSPRFNNAGFGQPDDDVPGIRTKGMSSRGRVCHSVLLFI